MKVKKYNGNGGVVLIVRENGNRVSRGNHLLKRKIKKKKHIQSKGE